MVALHRLKQEGLASSQPALVWHFDSTRVFRSRPMDSMTMPFSRARISRDCSSSIGYTRVSTVRCQSGGAIGFPEVIQIALEARVGRNNVRPEPIARAREFDS
jgi:hypothetical protein